jgi:hypothetical protein
MHRKVANIREIPSLVHRMESYFKGFTVEYIERNKNAEVDELAKAAAHNSPLLANVFFQVIEDALVKIVLPESSLINVIEGEDRRAPIKAYLYHYYEPDTKNDQTKMQQHAEDY